HQIERSLQNLDLAGLSIRHTNRVCTSIHLNVKWIVGGGKVWGRARILPWLTASCQRHTIRDSTEPTPARPVGGRRGDRVKELSDCRVPIVDDVKANVDILVEALRGEYKLSVALGGQQAIDAVHRSPPDL